MNSIEMVLRIDGKLYSGGYIVEDMGAFTLEDMMLRVPTKGNQRRQK
jgi:hypothetical protein